MSSSTSHQNVPGRTFSSQQVKLLRESFELLEPSGDILAGNFYKRLFEEYPDVEPLFADSDPEAQQKKLLAALKMVVANLEKPDKLNSALSDLGRRHQQYGAQPAHYPAVAAALIESMRELAGDAWKSQYRRAWRQALDAISTTMLGAYELQEEEPMNAANAEAAITPEAAGNDEELNRLRSAVNGAMTSMMMVDRDLVITYVNESTLDLMRKNADEMRRVYRGFDPERLVGTCIDDFHANPAHQRRILGNPDNMPYRTDIQVGSLRFNLNVTAIIDNEGNYIGNTLEWSDVTEQRRKQQEVARLQSAVDSSTSNLMLCDNDLNIVYANPAVTDMFRKRASELRQKFSGFDPENLVGQNIDQFHKNPAHQRSLLKDPSRLPATAEIQVLDLEFEVNATMIQDSDGNYMGNMVEWKDITEMKDAERQIRGLVAGAAQGEFSTRIKTDHYEGFFKQLGELLNELMEVNEQGLTDVADVIQKLAKGDLTGEITAEYHGLFGQLKNDTNATVVKLRHTVGKIREGGLSIKTSASEISQGNTDLSQRTEEQASSLEETASSMEQMTSAVQSNADNARQANQLSTGAREQAEKGGEVVSSAVDAMAAITESSNKISDIISVIDEIAFQTNLLALNAAVEAARAGEQGRGFAVVAAEVRNLAQRSAEAAKEIKGLIKDSVGKVDNGSQLVNQTGETLGEIVNAVKKVSDIVAEIAAASQEQSSGIEQVNKAITQLDEVTQQNAALVEESAAASKSMDDQAQSLAETVEFFNIGEVANEASAQPPRVAARTPAASSAARARPAPRAATGPARQAAVQTEGDDEWEEF